MTNDGRGGGADAAELFTVDQLAEISQNPDPVAYDLAGDRAALVPEMKKGGIVTKNQISAFLANVCQETDWLKTLEEYGNEDYHRSFLGDEWWYHGRGYIMNTWLDAYQRLSDVLGVDLVSNPDLLAQDKDLAARAAVWYRNRMVLEYAGLRSRRGPGRLRRGVQPNQPGREPAPGLDPRLE